MVLECLRIINEILGGGDDQMKIRVSNNGSSYFNNDLRAEGYVGDLESVANACVLVILKPGSRLRDAVKSLDILKLDLKHRIEMGQEKRRKNTPGQCSIRRRRD
jgi:hypothetical protein